MGSPLSFQQVTLDLILKNQNASPTKNSTAEANSSSLLTFRERANSATLSKKP